MTKGIHGGSAPVELRAGMSGDLVATLHSWLSELGRVLVIDEVERRWFGASTVEEVTIFQQSLGLATTGICDDTTWLAIGKAVESERRGPPSPPETTFLVHGRLRDAAGKPLAGAVIAVADKDLRHETELKRTETDGHGFYRAHYTRSQFRRPDKKRADLVVRAYHGQDLLVESAVLFHAPRVATIQLMVGGESYVGRSEFEHVVAEVAPLLDGVTPADLQSADLDFLAGETGLPDDQLQFFATAALLARQTGVTPAAFYGYAREGLPTDLAELLTLATTARSAALEQALDDNLIPLSIGAQLDEIEAELARAAVLLVNEPPAEGGIALGKILATSGATVSAQQTFLQQFAARTTSLETFWTALASDQSVGEQGAAALQFTFQATAVARGHLPMIEALQQLRQTGRISSARDLARLTNDEWTQLVAKTGVPDGAPGVDDADRADVYTRALAGLVAKTFPTAAFATQVDSTPANNDLRQFFANSSEFEFSDTHVEIYLQNHPAALTGVTDQAALTAQLKQLQRLFNLTPLHAEIQPLLADQLDSAQAIAKLGRESFVARYQGSLGIDRANSIFDRAQDVAAAAYLLFARLSPRTNGVTPAAITPFPVGG